MRKLLTKANIDFLSTLIDAYYAQFSHEFSKEKAAEIRDTANKFMSVKTSFHGFEKLGQILDSPAPLKLNTDETSYVNIEGGWRILALEELAKEFGRYGTDAISGLAELVLYTNALAKVFGTSNLFYRGENYYGYKLTSRAERYLDENEGQEAGITNREINELRRFQAEFKANLPYDFPTIGDLPDDDDPRWLPIMQHYDEKFGTRLLDITSSPFAGLYFACVSWDGSIDDSKDGLIYAFFPGGNMPIRGRYYDYIPENYDEEMDELPIENVELCFRDWEAPEVLRLYQSSFLTPRELAQDGSFLVKGALTDKYGFGQGFKFRVPAEVKVNIVRELWLAGYTPKRMVRGELGLAAHKKIESDLNFRSI